ncbi:hypothetical protein CC78DRAFT_569857 [Lojkania enalia]|uniref:C2H2-type domain-containing protein n=1 Tax=Lojkania enalia TaxID=147567 RepID=A0A9P4K6M2_9PLEO|nr:hypothetical protein CC78DRAFT_569857 [Didymosphaeria enalia]
MADILGDIDSSHRVLYSRVESNFFPNISSVNQRWSGEDRSSSIARRKKLVEPSEVFRACRDCKREFKRSCDLTKHEKSHNRPWKCPEEFCKYFELGWPTEKERDRHVNDKHETSAPQFKCLYPPCTYASKRESNCKQHMEKAHGWQYVRSKSNSRKKAVDSDSSTTPKPMTPLVSCSPFTAEDTSFQIFNLDSSYTQLESDISFNAGDFTLFATDNVFPNNDFLGNSPGPLYGFPNLVLNAPVLDPVTDTLKHSESLESDSSTIPSDLGFYKKTSATGHHNRDIWTQSPLPYENNSDRFQSGQRKSEQQQTEGKHLFKKRKKKIQKRDKKRLMSCIFRKFQPNTYNFGNSKFKTCHTTSHEYVSTLIRHLERYHNTHVCHKCLANFGSQKASLEHKETSNCVSTTGSQEDKWQILYENLCGDGIKHDPTFERAYSSSMPSPFPSNIVVNEFETGEKYGRSNPFSRLPTPKAQLQTPPRSRENTSQPEQTISSEERRELEHLREENTKLLRENNTLLRRLLQWESVCVPDLSAD